MTLLLAARNGRSGPNTNADTLPPTVPGSPSSSSVGTTTAIGAWTSSTDASGVDHYNIYNATQGVPQLLGTVAEATLPAAANFGTLVTQTAHAAAEYAGGCRHAMLELSWSSYETADGVYSAAYIASIQSQLAALQAAGMQVTLAMGVHRPPAWVKAMPNAFQKDQTGATTTQVDTIFNKQIRAKVEAYYTKIDADLGVENFWAIRLTSGGNAEMLHPGGNSYWAFGPNAQNGADMPTTMDANPFPGWKPGGADKTITTTQVRTWATWYVDALIDVTDWQMQFFAGLGFRGYYQTLTPGSGRRPSVFTSDVNNYLPNSTTGVGAVWDVYYANLRSRTKVIAYVSSVADGSGGDDFTQAGDNALALTSTTMNSWSATRWQTRIAHQYSMLVGGENPGYTTSGAAHYGDTTAAGLMAKSFAQVKGCGLFVFYWAHDDRLWDGASQAFANYSSGIALINSSVGGTVVNLLPNPDAITGGTAFGTSNTTVTLGSTDYAANGVGSAKVTVGGSPTTSTFAHPSPATGDAVENGHGRYTAAVGDTIDVLFTVKAHASNAASVNILPKVVGYHWNGSANIASVGGETNGTPILLAPGDVAVVAQRLTVATPPTDAIDGVLIIPHIRSGANVANAPVAAAVIYLDRMAAVRNAPRPLTTTDWFDGASAGASWGAAGANLASSTGTLASSAGALSFALTGLLPGQDNIIWITAVDASPAANESDPAILIVSTTGLADVTAPTVPGQPVLDSNTTAAQTFHWAGSTDTESGLDHYIVLRNGVAVNSNVLGTSYTDTGLAANTAYTYTVQAVDVAGNVSAASPSQVMTTDPGTDTIKPSNVTWAAGASNIRVNQMDLDWNPATDNSGTIASYKLYWNNGSGTTAGTLWKTLPGASTHYTATGLSANTTYAFAVTAVDPAGNESNAKSPTILPKTPASGGTGILFFLQGTNQKAQSGPSTGQSSLTKLGDRTAANGWTNAAGAVLVNSAGQAVNLGGVRGYYGAGSFPTAFDPTFGTGGSGFNTNKRQQMCFKGGSGWTTFQQWMTQAVDLPFCRWLNSILDGWEVACTPHHEPQDDFNTTNMTTAQFKAGVMRMAALLENRPMPAGQPVKDPAAPVVSLRPGVKAYMEVCFTVPVTATANRWSEMKNALPLASQLDAQSKVCVDAYQNPPPPISGSTYPTGNGVLGYFLNNVLKAYGYDAAGHGWTIGEWMCPARTGNVAGQAAAVNEYLNFCENRTPPAGYGPAGGQPYAIRMWEDRFGMVDGSAAKFDQTASAATKAVFVTHAVGVNARV